MRQLYGHQTPHRLYDLDTLPFNCQRSKPSWVTATATPESSGSHDDAHLPRHVNSNFPLSLSPTLLRFLPPLSYPCSRASLVEVNGFEPMASCVQGRRSPS